MEQENQRFVKYYAAKLTEYLGELKLMSRCGRTILWWAISSNGLYRSKNHIFSRQVFGSVAHWRVDEEVWASLEKVGLASIITRNSPQGLGSSRRWGLSGQLQRIALRGLMKQPSVLARWNRLQLRWKGNHWGVEKPIPRIKGVTVLWVKTHPLPEALKEILIKHSNEWIKSAVTNV